MLQKLIMLKTHIFIFDGLYKIIEDNYVKSMNLGKILKVIDISCAGQHRNWIVNYKQKT